MDNSNDEDGFKIYRDGELIASVGINTNVFQDKGLKYASEYTYMIASYNLQGETRCQTPTKVKTHNPPIIVTLDRIGVKSDHDPLITGAGDIYVYIGVNDGQGEPQTYRIPSAGVIKLKDNESKAIGQQIFFSGRVGEELRIVAIAFESDSGHGLALIITKALANYLYPGSGTAVGMVTTLLNSQPTSEDGYPDGATPESSEDDFVGAMEKRWTSAQNWGIGPYFDVTNGDLRLWFTVSTPGATITQQPPLTFQQPATSTPNVVPAPVPSAIPSPWTPPPVAVFTPTPVPRPDITITPTPATSKALSVRFDGWYNELSTTVNSATKGKLVTAKLTLEGGKAGEYQMRIRRAISWGSDQTVVVLSFSYDGVLMAKQLSFTPNYATNESSTEGYHVDLIKDGSSVWVMTNSYPPRLRVSSR